MSCLFFKRIEECASLFGIFFFCNHISPDSWVYYPSKL
ncbi:unnamed protein product [Spirodela intermedia]|uniref:Uncharacterized protein n=2 Tax=Spirodela intermedia TaxID=51605 RepID=A0A7I8JEV5_SPIIN|nr:unnamed protein product [Spirodela intermedia]CAA6667932.1 unnamed protein product [Spirodela intermedia]CAA7404752.1 unnamed protein product [Spirodela intermedia]